jgi:hypothetical protein
VDVSGASRARFDDDLDCRRTRDAVSDATASWCAMTRATNRINREVTDP